MTKLQLFINVPFYQRRDVKKNKDRKNNATTFSLEKEKL